MNLKDLGIEVAVVKAVWDLPSHLHSNPPHKVHYFRLQGESVHGILIDLDLLELILLLHQTYQVLLQ